MQNEEFSKRGHEKARVRSADAAVKKAVEHEAALERKTAKKARSTAKHLKPANTKNVPARTKRVSTKELYGIKKRHKGLIPLVVIFILLLIVFGVEYMAISIYDQDTAMLVCENTIEAGQTADLGMYVKGEPAFPQYVYSNLDFSTVNYTIPQTIRFTVTFYGTHFPCVLEIVDTTAPVAEGIPQKFYSTDPLPPVEDCIKDVYDLNDTIVEWEEIPDYTWGGYFTAKARITDAAGNVTIVDVPLTVTRDIRPPVIEGPEDIEVFIGDSISYMENVTVTDDEANQSTISYVCFSTASTTASVPMASGRVLRLRR